MTTQVFASVWDCHRTLQLAIEKHSFFQNADSWSLMNTVTHSIVTLFTSCKHKHQYYILRIIQIFELQTFNFLKAYGHVRLGLFRNKNVFRNIFRLFCSWEQNNQNGIQVFRNENSSQTNAYLHYSNYSYSGLIPNERALSLMLESRLYTANEPKNTW